jgi:hypothetical protein
MQARLDLWRLFLAAENWVGTWRCHYNLIANKGITRILRQLGADFGTQAAVRG